MHQVYNYMTHRAVGICSALRQDQFRAASEMTVNRLMEATQAQLKAIHETLKNQKLLNDMELENMNQFSKNDDQIKESQLQSLEKLKMAENIIDVTLTSLQQELELHKKSEAKLETIDSVTTEIAFRLAKHSAELHEEHKKIIEDVKEISTNLQLHNLQLLQQYNETLEFIADFRSVMLTLSSIANNIKNYVDSLFATLQEVGPGLTHELLVFLFLNLVYFMCGTIFMVFWNIQEKFCKFLLVALFLFNCCAVYNRAEVELIPLNIFAWLSFAGEKNWKCKFLNL